MEKSDKERAAIAAYYISKAVYELEEIELKEYESREVKTELFDITSSLADIEVGVRALVDRIRI